MLSSSWNCELMFFWPAHFHQLDFRPHNHPMIIINQFANNLISWGVSLSVLGKRLCAVTTRSKPQLERICYNTLARCCLSFSNEWLWKAFNWRWNVKFKKPGKSSWNTFTLLQLIVNCVSFINFIFIRNPHIKDHPLICETVIRKNLVLWRCGTEVDMPHKTDMTLHFGEMSI